jgi:hypothetical protein
VQRLTLDTVLASVLRHASAPPNRTPHLQLRMILLKLRQLALQVGGPLLKACSLAVALVFPEGHSFVMACGG